MVRHTRYRQQTVFHLLDSYKFKTRLLEAIAISTDESIDHIDYMGILPIFIPSADDLCSTI